ncbi:MAG: hypothetical protein J5766_03235 [Clostridia bacterium]|nr:hypothetical protein [Clostridia bacterium]
MLFQKKRMSQSERPIMFGRYPQSANGDVSPIEWILLGKKKKSSVLITKDCLICSGYCDYGKARDDLKYLEWRYSQAREKCLEFYEQAFTNEERTMILSRETISEASGDVVRDKVFLLSEEEVKAYFIDDQTLKASPSEYAASKGARFGWSGYESFTSWWLMPQVEGGERVLSPGEIEYPNGLLIYPKAVFHNGEIQYHSRNVYHQDFTIRPCIEILTE